MCDENKYLTNFFNEKIVADMISTWYWFDVRVVELCVDRISNPNALHKYAIIGLTTFIC